ncbi:Prefoldin [Pterulicium gracile]|uniref:Prefoldin n=1 Tax=Pterulicium gracile TaxID=1884261 RepID=A0A5C3R0T7_9AGAR|nr:Prefoldin [Pterula gracilis]
MSSQQQQQQKLQDANAEFNKIQAEMSSIVEARQTLGAQLSENETVQQEFKDLKPENVVYKLVGPALVKQDQAEAKSNVDTRIEFIKGEIQRVEEQLKSIEARAEKKRNEVVELNNALVQQQQQQQGEAASS